LPDSRISAEGLPELSSEVYFVAELKDGSVHQFPVDSLLIRNGDEPAREVAVERQANGQIPSVEIISVRRLP
jgi:hypothetical protein